MLSDLCKLSAAVLASCRIRSVNGTKSMVTSVGSVCSGDNAAIMAAVCKCGNRMGSLCSDDGDMLLLSVVSAVMMGMFAVCIKKCVELLSLHGILVLGKYSPSNCKWHRQGTPTTA